MGYCSVRRKIERNSRLLYFFFGKNTAEVVPLTSATATAIWTTLVQFCLNGNDSWWRAVSSKWDLVCTVCQFVCFSHTATHMQGLPSRINPIFVAGILFPDLCICNRKNEWIQAHRHQSRAWTLHIGVWKAQPCRPWRKHLLQPQLGWSPHEFVGRAIAGFDRELSAHQ